MTKTKSKQIFYFDALRALAIISVIVFHVFTITNGIACKEFVSAPTISWTLNFHQLLRSWGFPIF